MLRSSLLILTITILPFLSLANQIIANDAISKGLGNNAVTAINTWATINNQACLAWLDHRSLSVGSENYFLLKELNSTTFNFTLPVDKGGLGFTINRFGYRLFREQTSSISYGHQLSPSLSAGIGLSHHQLKLGKQYGRKNNLIAQLGLMSRINERLILGFHLHNIGNARLSEYNDERLTTTQQIGLQYLLSIKVQMYLELEKSVDERATTKLGIAYKVVTAFHLRAGILTVPSSFSFGFGTQSKNMRMDVAFSYHPTLGYQPSVSINYQFSAVEN